MRSEHVDTQLPEKKASQSHTPQGLLPSQAPLVGRQAGSREFLLPSRLAQYLVIQGTLEGFPAQLRS